MNTDSNNNLKLSGEDLTGLMQAVLKKKADFRFTAKGSSMAPFIKDFDVITISPFSDKSPVVGDVVALILKERKSIMVHRIVGKSCDDLIIKGDNNRSADGLFSRNRIAGLVTKVEREGKSIWYAAGSGRSLIAFFSKTGILNFFILPFLRKTKLILRKLFF